MERMCRCYVSWLFSVLYFLPTQISAASCPRIRFADIGWTDVAVTTALAEAVLSRHGYETASQQVSVPVAFRGMATGDLDVFLGLWLPSMAADSQKYFDQKSITPLGVVLEGAKYTLAVPDYVAQAGVKNFHDLAIHQNKFSAKIYGIEPGNDGNRLIQEIIKSRDFGLGDWNLVESSEQAMLAQVKQASLQQDWIVFLAWAPHPMNQAFKLHYLEGGDAYFGANLGAAVVKSVARTDWECSEAKRFLQNYHLSVDDVEAMMASVIDAKLSPALAAEKWLAEHPERAELWSKYFSVDISRDAPASPRDEAKAKLQLGRWILSLGAWVPDKVLVHLHQLSQDLNHSLDLILHFVLAQPPFLIIAALVVLVGAFLRRWQAMFLIAGGLSFVWALGFWRETCETLLLVFGASGMSLCLGIPLGIAASQSSGFYRCLRPLLDVMQTLPTFVYLIPALMLFGLGFTPGLFATVVFVLPLPIRMTYLGLSSLPQELRELGPAFGASYWQALWKIELPYAWPNIRAGISQSLMLALSMVVIAALVGADGLGKPVVQALNTVDIAKGIEAGLAIVVVALVLDRLLELPQAKRS